jgi:hypothetical protein
MIRLFLAGLLSFALASSAFAQGTTIVKSGPYKPLGHCQITSLASAVALVTASCSSGSVPAGAVIAEICVEVAAVRYLDDGTSPTTSLGILAAPSSATLPNCFAYAIKPMTQVKFIAVSGSPVIDVAFYAYQ